MLQKCPICGSKNVIILKGTVCDIAEWEKRKTAHDMGYSFCNCNNIFYTNWSNMQLEIYDDDYEDSYQQERVKESANRLIEKYLPYSQPCEKFLEIGTLNDFFLDAAKNKGYDVCGSDIRSRRTAYRFIEYSLDGEKCAEKFNQIFCSHVFEHVKNPINSIVNLSEMLVSGGGLFIAMPDPVFIEWNDPYTWDYWAVREHHIMWDMKSFINFVKKHSGLKCVYAERNRTMLFMARGDYHLVFKKA